MGGELPIRPCIYQSKATTISVGTVFMPAPTEIVIFHGFTPWLIFTLKTVLLEIEKPGFESAMV